METTTGSRSGAVLSFQPQPPSSIPSGGAKQQNPSNSAPMASELPAGCLRPKSVEAVEKMSAWQMRAQSWLPASEMALVILEVLLNDAALLCREIPLERLTKDDGLQLIYRVLHEGLRRHLSEYPKAYHSRLRRLGYPLTMGVPSTQAVEWHGLSRTQCKKTYSQNVSWV
eukprot:5484667-Amphidinium_carterae.2